MTEKGRRLIPRRLEQCVLRYFILFLSTNFRIVLVPAMAIYLLFRAGIHLSPAFLGVVKIKKAKPIKIRHSPKEKVYLYGSTTDRTCLPPSTMARS